MSSSATCQPSSPGIITSRRITSGSSLRAFSSPVGPSLASSTSIFSASRFTRQSSRIGASSSMTSTLVTSPPESCSIPARPPFSPLAEHRLLRERQREHEARAQALARDHPDAAPHGGEQLLRDEKPQPAAAAREVAARRLGSVELGEDPPPLGL